MKLPTAIDIIEVGPRDGLQNEARFVATDDKLTLITLLHEAGFQRIEATAFVHPKAVPQMQDAATVAQFCSSREITAISLTPNVHALERAIASNVPQIAVFVGASETFNEKNIQRSIDDSLAQCRLIFARAQQQQLFIRAYVSMAFSCPYEGAVSYEQVYKVVAHFDKYGAHEIVIGDTNGQAHPDVVYARFMQLQHDFPNATFVAHFHDTNGFGYANVLAALQANITRFDSSIAGLGGCPFSPGATGNISTEQLVKLCQLMQIDTNIDITALEKAAAFAKKII